MINLETLFKNHFDSPRISDDELRKFAEDHLQRLTQNNPGGIFTPLLGDTGAKYTAYFGAISSEDIASAVQQGLTVNMNEQLEAFKAMASRKEGVIRAAFGKDSGVYQQFYPHGITEYTKATLENAETLMLRLIGAGNSNSEGLPPDFVPPFVGIHGQFLSYRNAQLGQKGMVADDKDSTAGNRDALELQLISNIHFIGWKYPGDVQHCMAYFDQSIIREQNSSDAPNPEPAP